MFIEIPRSLPKRMAAFEAMTKITHVRPIAAGMVAALVAVGAFWFVHVRGPAGADAKDPALIALGERVYANRCASCHGEHLEGQPDWRRRLPNGRLPAPPHDAAGHTWHHPDRELFEITKKGPAAVAPGYESDMPAFKDVLDDREIWAVLAYIKSAWPAEIRARQQRINRHVVPGEGDGP
jgi:mono/diheme cytochrome c family protein